MKRLIQFTLRHKWKFSLVLFGLFLWFWNCLPDPLFNDPNSTVLEDKNGRLLGARIAADGQWRFPQQDSVPAKFKAAILTFEDQFFYGHSGVDVLSLGRAIFQNISQGEVVSGGSTLTMQVIRLMRKDKPRNLWNKMVEAIMATRMELTYNKEEILAMYASNAPFGGNVVGLDAAAWRYFGRSPDQLSWAESATLAVLPNSPALIHPGRNRKALRAKRDRLLLRLAEVGYLDSLSCQLAQMEPLPDRPHILPNRAPHLTDQLLSANRHPGKNGIWDKKPRMHSTLDLHVQDKAEAILQQHNLRLQNMGVYNAAALIVDVNTNDVIAYVGNVRDDDPEHQSAVDIITSRRSTGSILKPFLYAASLDDGSILPKMLMPDIPSYFGSYSPKNYDESYDGAVPADEALARSLNIPAIRMLHHYGNTRFYDKLENVGMTTLDQSPDHYGLSLILGGCEASLWDLAGMYAGLARTVNGYQDFNARYDRNTFRPLNWDSRKTLDRSRDYEPELVNEGEIGAGAAYLTLEALLEVSRPGADGNWRNFNSSQKIAWKTGTSYGFRDAWAIGCTPDYVVAIWAGNADGEGRNGLIGIEAAAPILFDMFNMLGSTSEWFIKPYDDLERVAVCSQSGHRALDICAEKDSIWIPKSGQNTLPCPYHQLVHLDATGQKQVHADCEPPTAILHKSWFVLPPAQEAYYKNKHVSYREVPSFREDCKAMLTEENTEKGNMEFIYPRRTTKIFVPRNLDGKYSSTIFEVAHRKKGTKIYWHLDREYLGTTETFHQMALNPKPGQHVLTLVDEEGEELKRNFEIIGKEQPN